MIYQGKAKIPVREVMLHCAAVSTGYFKGQTPFQVFSTINMWHHERGWKNGFGYHGLFMPDGEFYPGRPFEMIGAGCMGKNNGVIHFLLIERKKIDKLRKFEEYFEPEQSDAVIRKIRSIPGIQKVSGHNDNAAKLCPGFRVNSVEWLTGRSSSACA